MRATRVRTLVLAAVLAVTGALFTAAPAQAATGVYGVANYSSIGLGVIHNYPGPHAAYDYPLSAGGNSRTVWTDHTGGMWLPPGYCARRWVSIHDEGSYPPASGSSLWNRVAPDLINPGYGLKIRLDGDYWVKIVLYAC